MAPRGGRLLAVVALCFGVAGPVLGKPDSPPEFPRQFSATVETTAHLVDQSKDYPPWRGVIHLEYDYTRLRARAVVTEGLDKGKTFIRRYDNKTEYMIRSGEYPECQRAYLGEAMPLPGFPKGLNFQGMEAVEGTECEHWMHDVGTNRVHIYVEAHGARLPRRLTDEAVMEGESVPLMTYDLRELHVGGSEVEDATYGIPEPFHYRACTRQIGGFPYLHLFHWYLRI